MDTNSKIKKYAYYNNKFNYVFIDESGNSSNKMWTKVINDIEKQGYSDREYSTFSISGIFIDSKKKFSYLKKEVFSLKKKYLHFDKNTYIHRNELRNDGFLTKNNISKEDAWNFEIDLLDLLIKHKVPLFSSNFNRELIMKNPKFVLEFYYYKVDTLEMCIKRLVNNIFYFLKEKYPLHIKKKTILVFENSDKKKDKKVLQIFNKILEKSPYLKKYFKCAQIMHKNDIKGRPIVGNELIDFANYSLYLWASNSRYHKTKRHCYKYPQHEKKSLSLIDFCSSSITKPKYKNKVENFSNQQNISQELENK